MYGLVVRTGRYRSLDVQFDVGGTELVISSAGDPVRERWADLHREVQVRYSPPLRPTGYENLRVFDRDGYDIGRLVWVVCDTQRCSRGKAAFRRSVTLTAIGPSDRPVLVRTGSRAVAHGLWLGRAVWYRIRYQAG